MDMKHDFSGNVAVVQYYSRNVPQFPMMLAAACQEFTRIVQEMKHI